MANPIQQAFLQVPLITRTFATACCLTTLACQLELVTPYQLYFNLDLVLTRGEAWRLITNFLYFGNIGIDFIFHMFFLVRYSRLLEEGSFRGKPGDYFYCLLLGAIILTIVGPWFSVYFLGLALTFMLVYLWARRNPQVRMSLLGLFVFPADYLPWVLLGLSMLLGGNPIGDILGIAVGHVYYFLEDVYPKPRAQGGLGGQRVLTTPSIM